MSGTKANNNNVALLLNGKPKKNNTAIIMPIDNIQRPNEITKPTQKLSFFNIFKSMFNFV